MYELLKMACMYEYLFMGLFWRQFTHTPLSMCFIKMRARKHLDFVDCLLLFSLKFLGGFGQV